MVFADLKNDFVFRRIFATHPEILRGLLNDLLERQGEQAIEAIEYLPPEQLPLVPGLTEVPADLPAGPHREAVELANEATFTPQELEAYRKVMDEIQQAREYGDAKRAEGFAEGETAGFAKGETAGKAAAILAFLAARGIAVSDEARARIEGCRDAATLDRWIARAATAASAEEVTDGPQG